MPRFQLRHLFADVRALAGKPDEQRGEKPILLLDDLFDKLDTGRVEQLIRLVSGDDFGQILITDCNKVRLERILGRQKCPYVLNVVENGGIIR